MRAFPLATAGGLPTNDLLSVSGVAPETKVGKAVSKAMRCNAMNPSGRCERRMKVHNRLSGGSERVKIIALMHLVNGMAVRRDHAHTRSLSQAVSRLKGYSQLG